VARSPGLAWLSLHGVEVVTQLDPLPHAPVSGRSRRAVASVHPRWDTTRTRATSWRLHFRYQGKQQALTFTSEEHARRWADVFNSVGVPDGLALLKAHLRAETVPGEAEEQSEPPEISGPSVPSEPESGVRSVRDAVEACIDDLTGVEPGYIDRCRADARRYIYPVLITVDDSDRGGTCRRIPLGEVPLERFDRQIAKSWTKELILTRRGGRGPQAEGTLSRARLRLDRAGLVLYQQGCPEGRGDLWRRPQRFRFVWRC
jgi:hypothetical protein